MRTRNAILRLVTVILLFTIVSCAEEKTYRIGVSQCSNDDWRNKMNDEIEREIMFHPEASVEIRSADDSNEKQISDIRYFMTNGFDIIIAAPNEADAITPVIQEVYNAGIPVIIFDRNINGDSYTAYQGVDNMAIGKAAAEYARNIIKPHGKIIEIYGLKGSTPAIGRHDGFISRAADLGLDLVSTGYGNWNYDRGSIVADSLLDLYPDVDLIYAHNDRMAIAASDVARRKKMDVKVIGVDAAPEIGIRAVADSVIDATFLYPTEGHRLIRTALSILEGKPYQKKVELPFPSAVDKSNADILLLQNESLKEETDKIKRLKAQVDDYWTRHSAQTTLFYAAIFILILLFILIFVILRIFWQHKRHQRELLEQNRLLEQQRDTEKELNEQLNAATQSKLMFFTNVSHDLRTPLTLIAEPVEQLVDADNLTPRQRTLMKIADKNVKILHRLINQILDFRKYENGKLNLHLAEVRPASLFTEWIEAFNAVALKRDIKLTVNMDVSDDFTIALDTEKLERVFFNIMSNAFKYTPDNGSIHLECSTDSKCFVFSIKDTGRGIPAEDLGNIFHRFYQVDKVHPNGSGIGLSLAKAFVELHGGRIEAESVPGEGSVFTVSIPLSHTDVEAEETSLGVAHADPGAELIRVDAGEQPMDSDLPLMLVIDDNSDIRLMIRQLLGDEYRIIEAADGKDGIRLAAKYVPDIIVCDVMMPVMDGLECCRRIKEEITTSHIPVMMLTACSMDEQRMQGYESGADAYLSKPFNEALLRARCRNLITNRKRIKELWQSDRLGKDTSVERVAPAMNQDIDNEFYTRFLEVIKSKLGNPDLNIEGIATELGIGRSQFYRKIKALTNYSPVELLRKLRIERSRELIASTSKTVSEIAYEVGFSSPAYFTRIYRETYGETPTDTRSRLGQ